jgi:hypothetical protein
VTNAKPAIIVVDDGGDFLLMGQATSIGRSHDREQHREGTRVSGRSVALVEGCSRPSRVATGDQIRSRNPANPDARKTPP